MKVKICGITRLEDGLAAAKAGADLLGFNFYIKSPRCLEIPRCQEIIAAVRKAHPVVRHVGVFVNASLGEIQHTLDACGLDLAQLTGEETLVLAAAAALGERAYMALRLPVPAHSLPGAVSPVNTETPAFLVDAHLPGMYGGTGQVADWDLAADLAARYPILLAGGLNPGNVRAAIARVKPWGVDVASGVESEPGIKDHEKVRQFIQTAQAINQQSIQEKNH